VLTRFWFLQFSRGGGDVEEVADAVLTFEFDNIMGHYV
jgi:hypothetical protein